MIGQHGVNTAAGRLSQVVLHLSSRKRSYHCRLQAGNVSLEGTCTLLIKCLHRRTSARLRLAVKRRGSNDFGDRQYAKAALSK